MTEPRLTEAQYQAAIEAYKKVSRTRIDDSSRAVIAAIAEHVQYSSEAAQEPRFTLAEIEAAILAQGMTHGGRLEFANAIRARLSPKPPDRAPEERVTVRRELLTQLQRGRHARAGMVAANLSEGIAFQIRATRDAQGITQAALAEATGMSQNNISRLENPEYGKHTVSSLKRIADALDVALVVRLVPFSQYIDWLSGRPYLDRGISVTALAVPEYAKDLGLKLRTIVVDGYGNGGYADSRCDCHTSRRSY
jgi:transcriptional regulator with XRE-family HTH domain